MTAAEISDTKEKVMEWKLYSSACAPVEPPKKKEQTQTLAVVGVVLGLDGVVPLSRI